MRTRHVLSAVVVAALLAGCAPDVDVPQSSGLGSSDLAPSIKPDHQAGKAHPDRTKHRPKKAKAKPGKAKPSRTAVSKPGARRTTTAAAASSAPATARALSASLSDPSGDVSGSLTKAPDQVDIVGATLTRGPDGFSLRVSFAGAVPARDAEKTENVASFYDVDGDGQVDYEVWATLADNGWSGSYRFPDGARFGSDSQVSVRVDGRDLVLGFPLTHLRQARAFRWSVGAEWGTYEQVAAGATAHDTAPDQGVVAFPG